MANFSESDRSKLLANPNVLKVTASNVSFTPEFKLKALKSHKTGLSPNKIFEDAGIDLSLFSDEYAKFSLRRWKNSFNKLGANGFKEEHRGKGATGRPAKKFKSLQDEVNYLRAELDALKKLQALALAKSQK
jgi:transposase